MTKIATSKLYVQQVNIYAFQFMHKTVDCIGKNCNLAGEAYSSGLPECSTKNLRHKQQTASVAVRLGKLNR